MKKKIIIGSLLGAILCASGATVAGISSKPKYVSAFTEIQFASQYVVGDIVDFPESGFTVGADYYKAETVLHYPDGNAMLTTGEKFSQTGEYTLEYRAEVNGKLYSESFDFTVLKDLYSVSSSRSSASYGLDDSQYQTGLSGISVSLAQNDTFTYNKVLDLRELDDEWVISLMMLPQTSGEMDVNVLLVKLTDAYDESNSVYVRISAPNHPHQDNWANSTGMLFAGTSPNMLMGAYGTRVRTAHDYFGYGYQCYFTFGDNAAMIGKNQAGFKFDLENKLLHGPNPQDNGVTTMFADLTDESVYPSAWKGFTTGEVYLSLYCEDYYKESANVFITQIGTEDLATDYVHGGIDSSVSVDLADYDEENLPKAEVGKAYPLFEGKIYDYYKGESVVLPRVFHHYGTWMESEINVTNNAFVPDREGVYTLVYGHTDGLGSYVSKTLEVQAVNNVEELTASVSEEKETQVKLGLPVRLADIVVEGGSGKPVTTIVVKKDGESIETDGEFVFTEAGVYEVSYIVRDYLGTVTTCSYQVNAELNPTPVAQGSVSLPKYFIEGQKYVLPSLAFTDYSTANAQNLTAEITVTDGDGVHKLTSQEYVAKAAADGTVSVQYSVQGNTLKPIVVPVINVNGEAEDSINIMKYFLFDEGISVGENSKGLRFSAIQDGGFEFINAVLADTFALKMQIDANANGYSGITVRLTDSANEKESVEVSFKKENQSGSIGVYVNGLRISGAINATFMNGKHIQMKFSGNILQVDGTQIYSKVKQTVYGEPFNCFTSGKVYFKVELNGIESVGVDNAALIVHQINNQTLSSSLTKDKMGPEMKTMNDYVLIRAQGETITLYDILMCDVLNGYVDATVTVTYKNMPVKAVDGTVLSNAPLKEYQFIASEYGEYAIVYKVKDGENNSARGGNTFQIIVLDDVPPVLTVDGKIPYSVVVGKSVSLPNAKVTDNITADMEYYIYVICPNGNIISCREKMKFTPNEAGVYEIVYMVRDEEGNLTVEKFTVEAK